MSTEAMKLALEALEMWCPMTATYLNTRDKAITALRQALAQPQQDHFDPLDYIDPETGEPFNPVDQSSTPQPTQPQQEPVLMFYEHEWQGKTSRAYQWLIDPFSLPEGTKLYTSPPAQQEPVEYWTVANGWVSDQAEVPAAVWVEPDFWEHCNRVNCGTAYRLPAPGRQPLYTSPPAQRKPLTDEQIETVWRSVQANDFHDCVKPFARAIEAAHNIKGDA